MKPAERLREISDLHDRAARLSQEVGTRLKAGTPPVQLVSLLREQAEAVDRLRNRLTSFTEEQPPVEISSEAREELVRLQAAFRDLAGASEENYRLASRKGIRLTGVGGKPYTPPRRRKSS